MHTSTPTIRTVAFFVYPGDTLDAFDVATGLITRSAWFTVDPYPDGVTRFDVKPEAAASLTALGVSQVAP